MKQLLLYINDPNARKTWLAACEHSAVVLKDLNQLSEKQYSQKDSMLIVQVGIDSSLEKIISLSQKLDTIVASNHPQDGEGLTLFQNGIKGYVNTFSTIERIQQVIDTVQAGNVWLGQSIMQMMIQSLTGHAPTNDGWRELLTDREQQTTELVLESKTNKEIARVLGITERTVKAHLHNIFEKIQVSDRLALALKIKNWV